MKTKILSDFQICVSVPLTKFLSFLHLIQEQFVCNNRVGWGSFKTKLKGYLSSQSFVHIVCVTDDAPDSFVDFLNCFVLKCFPEVLNSYNNNNASENFLCS